MEVWGENAAREGETEHGRKKDSEKLANQSSPLCQLVSVQKLTSIFPGCVSSQGEKDVKEEKIIYTAYRAKETST